MKHLYDSLRGCAKEEEVKAEFCKFFKIEFAAKGLEYIERIVGSEWWMRGNVRLCDMAAGTGNREFKLISPNGGVSFSIEYEVKTHSDSEGDITVTASLMLGDSGETLSDSASTTAVKVLLEAQVSETLWAHTRERRAGQWNDIGNDNLFLMEDQAMMGDVLPPMAPDGTLTNDVSFGWRDGAIIWTIPLGWNERGTSGETDPIKTNAVPEHQTFIITPDGTLSVMKAGCYVSRGTNTHIRSGRVRRLD